MSTPVLADQYDDQIAVLKQQAEQQQQVASQYSSQANDYRARVKQLQAQMAALQAQINLNQLRYRQLVQKIAENEAQLASQKIILSESIRDIYQQQSVSPIEALATSSSLSDFADRQEYQSRVKQKIQDAMSAVSTLQEQLASEKEQTTASLALQNSQQQQLSTQRTESAQLLSAATRSEAAANQQVKASNQQIATLQAQQLAEISAKYGNNYSAGGACGGGYPGRWCIPPQDTVVDSWGMWNRECVSYTAFKVAASGRRMPYWGGYGNANQWPGNARASGIKVDGSPRVGDVAISYVGPYGHSMYVEAVLSGQRVLVSQYNYGSPGIYSEMTIPISGLEFIHF